MAVPGKTKQGKMEPAMDEDAHKGELGKTEGRRWRGTGGGAPTSVEDREHRQHEQLGRPLVEVRSCQTLTATVPGQAASWGRERGW